MLSFLAAQTIPIWTKIKKIFNRELSGKNEGDQVKFKQFNVKDELKELPVSSIRSWQRSRSIPYSVAMYNNIRDFNLASVIRNASAFAIQEINIIGWRKYDKRGAVGSYNYVKINHFDNFSAFLKYVGSHNLVALELPEHYPNVPKSSFMELSEFEWRPGYCILIGEEGPGIPESDLNMCWHKVKITIPGSMRSLNAATSSGIAMYSASRYHQKYVSQ
jgi:tRNA G18 (ribose-2'-O)-methylase SpoU